MKNKDILYIYTTATKIARENNQTTGEKNDYYITLAQLESLLMKFKKE